jgi:hypothetical protein
VSKRLLGEHLEFGAMTEQARSERKTQNRVAALLTCPPEMAKLDELVRALQPPPVERAGSPIEPQQTRDVGPGVFGTIGALAFGLGMAEAVFGRKHG